MWILSKISKCINILFPIQNQEAYRCLTFSTGKSSDKSQTPCEQSIDRLPKCLSGVCTAISSVILRQPRSFGNSFIFYLRCSKMVAVLYFSHFKSCFEDIRSVLNQWAIARVGRGIFESWFEGSRTVEIFAEIRQNWLIFACLLCILPQTLR